MDEKSAKRERVFRVPDTRIRNTKGEDKGSFDATHIIGSEVVRGVPPDLAVDRALKVREMVGLASSETVSTDAIRFMLDELRDISAGQVLGPLEIEAIRNYLNPEEDIYLVEVHSVNPSTTERGATVTIYGDGFLELEPIVVEFSNNNSPPDQNQSAVILFKTNTELVVKVPRNGNSGPISVRIGTGRNSFYATSTFEVMVRKRPEITSLDPKQGLPGDTVRIEGYNLLSAQTKFHDGIPAYGGSGGAVFDEDENIVSDDKGWLNYRTYPVPIGVVTGPILVMNVDGSVLTEEFEVLEPGDLFPVVITSFVPHNGTAGTEVTIHGTFDPVAANNLVYFGESTHSTVPSFSDGSILRVIIPNDARTGPIRVRVVGAEAKSSDNFYLPPTIAEFHPTAAPVNYMMRIYGTNFEKSNRNKWDMNIVKFNGVQARIRQVGTRPSQHVQQDYIDVDVPSGFTVGNITIETPGGMATSTEVFTVNQ